MTKEQFIEQLKNTIFEGSCLINPGGGTSKIVGIKEEKLSYIRGSSRMYLPYSDAFMAFNEYSGRAVSTNDLKKYNPAVFDSKRGGHDCNCTVLFCILEEMKLIDGGIMGSGKPGSPFYIKIK